MILSFHRYFTETEKKALRTGFQQKRFRLKTCPQVVLQAQEEKLRFWIFTT